MPLIYSALYFMLIGIASFLIGRILPRRLFRPYEFPYKSWAFEDEGRLYNDLHISAWQSRVPDMSRIFARIMPPKRLTGRPSDSQLVMLIQETCIAEFIHTLLCIAGLYVLKIWPGAGGWIAYAVYVLLGNLPFILIQRYNRPRFVLLLRRSRERGAWLRSKRAPGERKALVLSCNTGEGHNSCARAVKEVFDDHEMACDIEDALRFISPGVSRFMSKGHVFVYRHLPRLFRFGYRFSEKHPGLFTEKSLIYRLLTYGTEPLASFIVESGYDVVITTHVFSALMLTAVKKRHKLQVRTTFVATDYTRSPSMEMSDLDAYFVPDASLIRDFTVGAIKPERIIDSGVPVRQEIYHCTEKVFAKRSLGLPEDCRHLLVMCGSMGCGPLKWLILLLAADLKENQYITLVCGTNQRLKRKMEQRYARNPRVRVYGFRKDISLLMDSADLYLTKPGGLSVTEAAVKNLPMVMINAVAGCEEYNKNFYVKSGLGVTSESVWSLARLCMDILSDDECLAQMAAAGRRKKWQNAAKLIYSKVMGEAEPDTSENAVVE